MATPEMDDKIETGRVNEQKRIGLTTAIVAVLLAVATMVGNSANTQKIVIETKTADWWAYTHSSDTNWRVYSANAILARASHDEATAGEFDASAREQKKISDDARSTAQGLERFSAHQERKSYLCGIAELFLQITIVVCSVSLLTDLLLFWHLSFVTTAAGIVMIVLAVLER